MNNLKYGSDSFVLEQIKIQLERCLAKQISSDRFVEVVYGLINGATLSIIQQEAEYKKKLMEMEGERS